MTKFQVKVCGITRAADAQCVAELGGDMIGMIFYPRSPRRVTMGAARNISEQIPPTLDCVGVFVDENTDTILRIADRVRLNIIQLHGDESRKDILRLRREGYKVIKAFSVVRRSDYNRIVKSPADFVMIDARSPGQPGGTGRTFDWSVVPGGTIQNLVLAGGLNAGNVSEGVRRFHPLVVDVNSGVETSPGIKSVVKLKRFFEMCDRLRYGKK